MTTHPTISTFSSVNGELTIGGQGIERLAARVGSTPFFVYSRSHITARVDHLRSNLPGEVELSYAVKANPMPAVVHHIAGLVDSLDVASAGEMLTALNTTIAPERVSFAGPGKTSSELTQAVAAGVTIELESFTEADRVVAAGDQLGIQPRVAIRVNPDFQVKSSGMRMGGGPQQFGVDAELVPNLLKRLGSAEVDVLGFHVFPGSQNLNAELLNDAQRKTVDLVIELASDAPSPVRYLNLGGGFGIPYFPKDTPLDLAAIGDHLADLVASRIKPNLPEARTVIELGRFIVGEAGLYVTRVVDRKSSRGAEYLVVDGGLHHQLAASGNFGQVIRKNYPIAIGNRFDGQAEERISVVGCLCTPLDLLGDGVELPRAEIGDLVILFQAGAYGLTASPTAFLGHPPPVEILV